MSGTKRALDKSSLACVLLPPSAGSWATQLHLSLGQHPGSGSRGVPPAPFEMPRFHVVGWASGVTVGRALHLSSSGQDLPASPSVPAPHLSISHTDCQSHFSDTYQGFISVTPQLHTPLMREPRDERCGGSPLDSNPNPLLLLPEAQPVCLPPPLCPGAVPTSQQLLHAAW